MPSAMYNLWKYDSSDGERVEFLDERPDKEAALELAARVAAAYAESDVLELPLWEDVTLLIGKDARYGVLVEERSG